MKFKKKDYYYLIQEAKKNYKNSGNISAFLRDSLKLKENTSEIIEIAYDLQAGNYVKNVRKNPHYYHKYYSEIASYLDKYVDSESSLLEIGCGEATTTFGVFEKLNQKPNKVFGFDISFSRIKVGIDFWDSESRKFVSPSNILTIFFVADLFHIPLATKSIDVVYTSHSIEPNGGREVEALKNIFRISKKRVLLFEPCFEAASLEGKQRMCIHGYIKKIPDAVKEAGGIIRDVQRIHNIANPLNPTYLFDIEVPLDTTYSNSSFWADPITLKPLDKLKDCFYCPTSGLAYPVISGIPCLRPEHSVLATHLLDY